MSGTSALVEIPVRDSKDSAFLNDFILISEVFWPNLTPINQVHLARFEGLIRSIRSFVSYLSSVSLDHLAPEDFEFKKNAQELIETLRRYGQGYRDVPTEGFQILSTVRLSFSGLIKKIQIDNLKETDLSPSGSLLITIFDETRSPEEQVEALIQRVRQEQAEHCFPTGQSREQFEAEIKLLSVFLYDPSLKKILSTSKSLLQEVDWKELAEYITFIRYPVFIELLSGPIPLLTFGAFKQLVSKIIEEKAESIFQEPSFLEKISKAKYILKDFNISEKILGHELRRFIRENRSVCLLSSLLDKPLELIGLDRDHSDPDDSLISYLGDICDGLLYSRSFQRLCKEVLSKLGEEKFQELISYLKQNEHTTWNDRKSLMHLALEFNIDSKEYQAYLTLVGSSTLPLDELKKAGRSLLLACSLSEEALSEEAPSCLESKIAELDLLIDRFKTPNGDDVTTPLDETVAEEIRAQYVKILHHGKLTQALSDMLLDEIIREAVKDQNSDLLISGLQEKYKRSFGFYPYPVQLCNILLFLRQSRALAEIKTGEGKTTIIVLLTAYLALMNKEQVEIIVPTKDLAEREFKNFSFFYKSLDLSTGMVCDRYQQREAFLPQILYGRISDFEFADLLEAIAVKKNVFIRDAAPGGRRRIPAESNTFSEWNIRRNTFIRRAIIIDECDAPCLDDQDNQSRIVFPSKNKLLTPGLYKAIYDFYLESKSSGLPLSSEALKVYLKNTAKIIKHMSQINDDDANRWLSSVSFTDQLKEGHHYFIDRTTQKIVIMDQANTGERKAGQRWNYGIHSFLEAKHGLPIKIEDSVAGSMAHVLYLNDAQKLYALSGTIGNSMDRAIQEKFFRFSLIFDSPRHRPTQKKVLADIILDNAQDHEDTVIQYAIQKASETSETFQRYAVILMAEDINQTEKLAGLIRAQGYCDVQVYNGVQPRSPELVIADAGLVGMITVVTNIAGRGTDYTPMPGVTMYMIISGITQNKRVEKQAEGRVGRQGRPGVCVSVLNKEKLWAFSDNPASMDITQWRQYRDNKNARNQCIVLLNLPKYEILHAALGLFKKLKATEREVLISDWLFLYSKWSEQQRATPIEQFFLGVVHDLDLFIKNAERYLCSPGEAARVFLGEVKTISACILSILRKGAFKLVLDLFKTPEFASVLESLKQSPEEPLEDCLLRLQSGKTLFSLDELIIETSLAVMFDLSGETNVSMASLLDLGDLADLPILHPYDQAHFEKTLFVPEGKIKSHLERLDKFYMPSTQEEICSGYCLVLLEEKKDDLDFILRALKRSLRFDPSALSLSQSFQSFERDSYAELIRSFLLFKNSGLFSGEKLLKFNLFISALVTQDKIDIYSNFDAWKAQFKSREWTNLDFKILSFCLNIAFKFYNVENNRLNLITSIYEALETSPAHTFCLGTYDQSDFILVDKSFIKEPDLLIQENFMKAQELHIQNYLKLLTMSCHRKVIVVKDVPNNLMAEILTETSAPPSVLPLVVPLVVPLANPPLALVEDKLIVRPSEVCSEVVECNDYDLPCDFDLDAAATSYPSKTYPEQGTSSSVDLTLTFPSMPGISSISELLLHHSFGLLLGSRVDASISLRPSSPASRLDFQGSPSFPATLKLQDCGAGGNCLFLSVAEQVRGESHDSLRARTVAAMVSNKGILETFLIADGAEKKLICGDKVHGFSTMDEYINLMSQSGAWGSESEAALLAQILRRPIVIFNPSYKRFYPSLTDATGNHYDGEPIFLYFKLNHYQALVPSHEGVNLREVFNGLFQADAAALGLDETSPLPSAAGTASVFQHPVAGSLSLTDKKRPFERTVDEKIASVFHGSLGEESDLDSELERSLKKHCG